MPESEKYEPEIQDECIIHPCVGCDRRMVANEDCNICKICQLEQELSNIYKS